MLTITLSRHIEKMEIVRMRSFLSNLIRYSIRTGNVIRMISETTKAVQGFINLCYIILGKKEGLHVNLTTAIGCPTGHWGSGTLYHDLFELQT